MVTIFLFIFVATWNNFILPQLMISSQELKPITLGLYGMASYFSPQYGPMMMASCSASCLSSSSSLPFSVTGRPASPPAPLRADRHRPRPLTI